MVRINRVYTRTGDEGMTSLADQRISKASLRINAIGLLDELNSWLGFVNVVANEKKLIEISKQILLIQNKLFDLGASLAVTSQNQAKISMQDVQQLEQHLDEMNATLPSLNSFILPGGSEITTRLHLARTCCRHAERSLVALKEVETLPNDTIPYINRLSDWLFVAARFVNKQLLEQEVLWQPSSK